MLVYSFLLQRVFFFFGWAWDGVRTGIDGTVSLLEISSRLIYYSLYKSNNPYHISDTT
jgi:hypothetical protein